MSVTINGTTGITTPDVDSSADISVNGLTVGKGAGNVSTNTAVGVSALAANTTGAYNTAVGYQALTGNTTGEHNIAVGYLAGSKITTGSLNVSIGRLSMDVSAAITGQQNNAVGNGTLRNLTSGDYNQAFGSGVLQANTTGSNNIGVGQDALRNNTTASNNTVVGYQAGYSGTTSGSNVFVGLQAGYYTTTGSKNTFVGPPNTNGASGWYVTTGNANTIIGGYTGNNGGLDIRTANNWIVLSDGDGYPRLYWDGTNSRWRAPSGQFQIQYAYDTTSGSAANVIVGSDGAMFRSTSALKYKQDIRDLESIDVGMFRPVRYKSKSQVDDPTKDHIGIIADEVHDAGLTELVTYGPDGAVEGFQYERLTVVLLKAVQDLKATVEAQATEIAALKGQ